MLKSRSRMRIGTRASPLALVQAEMVRSALCLTHGWDREAVEIVPMTAVGDMVQDRRLADLGGKALWTEGLDRALMAGEIDCAVHSMKDVETIRPSSLQIAAFLPRASTHEHLIGAASIGGIPAKAKVGTASPRRTAQILRLRPDVRVVTLRGNVQTRLNKVAAGDVAATFLAAAGLERLGRADVGVPVSEDEMLPAPSQGAIGIECLIAEPATLAALAAIDDEATRSCVEIERHLLSLIGGGCNSPVGALATSRSNEIRLRAELLSEDGSDRRSIDLRFVQSDKGALTGAAETLLNGAPAAIRRLFNPAAALVAPLAREYGGSFPGSAPLRVDTAGNDRGRSGRATRGTGVAREVSAEASVLRSL